MGSNMSVSSEISFNFTWVRSVPHGATSFRSLEISTVGGKIYSGLKCLAGS
jgi:hypothetical protein